MGVHASISDESLPGYVTESHNLMQVFTITEKPVCPENIVNFYEIYFLPLEILNLKKCNWFLLADRNHFFLTFQRSQELQRSFEIAG